jgi:hypothetical protein
MARSEPIAVETDPRAVLYWCIVNKSPQARCVTESKQSPHHHRARFGTNALAITALFF